MSKQKDKFTLDYKEFNDFKEQIDISYNHLIENDYEYGPDFKDKNKKYSVNRIEKSNEVSRFYFDYSINGFDELGEEYVEIDSENNILTRRITKFPKSKRPIVLMFTTLFSVLLAIIVIPWVFLNSDNVDPLYKSGKVLWIKSEKPIYQNKVHYDGPDAVTNKLLNWEIDSVDNERQIGLVKLEVINETANTITLNIDEKCAELLSSNGKTYYPSNTIIRAKEVSNIIKDHEVKDFVPLWGDITLVQGTQVVGYLIVDLPRDVTINRLRWVSSDSVTIDY